jgi:hypothetical protein
MTRRIFYIPVLFLIFFTSCKDSKPIELKFQLAKGDKYEYTSDVTMELTQQWQSQEMKMNTRFIYTYLFEVQKDSADWKQLSATIMRVRSDISSGKTRIVVDTDSTGRDTMSMPGRLSKMYQQMKGKTFWFDINSKGEVGEVTGMEEMLNEFMADSLADPQLVAQMRSGFNKENFRQNINQTFAVYPGKAVKEGDSWSKSSSVNSIGIKVNTDNTYKLQSVDGNDAKVKISSSINAPKSVTKGMSMTMKGTTEGIMHYDILTGIATGGKVETNVDMEMVMNGETIPARSNMIIVIKGKKQ